MYGSEEDEVVQDTVQQHAVVNTISGVETSHYAVILLVPFPFLFEQKEPSSYC